MSQISQTICIRAASSSDVSRLSQLGRESFAETYRPYNTATDLAAHLASTYSLEMIGSNIEDPGQDYLIALVDGVAAGFGLLRSGPCPDGLNARMAFEVHQLYVLRKYQRLRLGTRLVDALTDLAKERGGDALWLSVWERADWARRFYERYGFESFGQVGFKLGSSDQADILMHKNL
jgi:ribosomal protein S18 acetylase RimI-like enzyme